MYISYLCTNHDKCRFIYYYIYYIKSRIHNPNFRDPPFHLTSMMRERVCWNGRSTVDECTVDFVICKHKNIDLYQHREYLMVNPSKVPTFET